MKIIKNEKLIKRNAQIGSWTSLAALVVLGSGCIFPSHAPNCSCTRCSPSLLGFTLTQIGMYMGNKFGRSPRPDEKLDAGLKGLQNEFVMYHYTTPVSHLLVGPAGVWVVMPYHQRGQVTFKKNRWQMSGGGFLQSYMRIFGQEGLGRPDIEIDNEIKSLKKYLSKHMDESEIPEINALMVFTNDDVEIDARGFSGPGNEAEAAQGFHAQKAKEKKLPAETLNKVKTVLE